MIRRRSQWTANPMAEGEFLWLMSLSDMLILLFVFFVVLFSLNYKKISKYDLQVLSAALRNEEKPKNPLAEVFGTIDKFVESKGLAGDVEVKKKDDAVLVEIKDRVLFGSGEYVLNREGQALAEQLAGLLEQVPDPYRIGIEGHTDDVPIKTSRIADNWDLGGKRAHALLMAMKLSPTLGGRTILMSFGDQKPLLPNRTEAGTPILENRMRNRRVTLRIF